jgi:hypothetical protein
LSFVPPITPPLPPPGGDPDPPPVVVLGAPEARSTGPGLGRWPGGSPRGLPWRAGWDVLGLAVALLVMLAVQRVLSDALDTPLGHPAGVRPVAMITTAVAIVLLVVLSLRDRPRPSDLVRLVTLVWTDPPGPWVAAPLGALLAIPLFSLYVPVLLRDADSARVVAAVAHVRTHGIGFILDTQDNLLPHLILGPAVGRWGLHGALTVTILSLLVLAAVVSYLTCRITGSMAGAAAAAVALVALPPVTDRTGFVPMYPTMLALGYLGAWLAYRTMTADRRPWAWAAAAGICLALAPEAQALGQLFLFAPILLLAVAPDRGVWLAACARIYLFVALASVPRAAVNVSEGGLAHLASYRTDYWITKGYVRDIQTDFWHYKGTNEPLGPYLLRLPGRFAHSLGAPQGWVVLGLALAAWLLACRGRGRLLVAAVVGFMVLAVTVKQVPPFPRYYAPLWPGLAILAGIGVATLARRRRPPLTALAGIVALVLVVTASTTLVTVAHSHENRRASVERAPYRELAAMIDDGRGVIGARSHALLNVTTDIPTWGGQFLTEDEYATFLTWPSDDAVIEMMQRHDIGWVLIQPNPQLETNYHDTWLIPNHGLPARQPTAVAASPAFCLTADVGGFKLYRLGGCGTPGGAASGAAPGP